MAQIAPASKGASGNEAKAFLFDSPSAIETVSLYLQTLKDAPTKATDMEIRRQSYRTPADALTNVRGFYFTLDGCLQYASVRDFILAGGHNTRILVPKRAACRSKD